MRLLEGQLPDGDEAGGEARLQRGGRRRSSAWGATHHHTPDDTFNTLTPTDTPRSLPDDDDDDEAPSVLLLLLLPHVIPLLPEPCSTITALIPLKLLPPATTHGSPHMVPQSHIIRALRGSWRP